MKVRKPWKVAMGLLVLLWVAISSNLLWDTIHNDVSLLAPLSRLSPAYGFPMMNGTVVPGKWNQQSFVNSKGKELSAPRFMLGIMTHDMVKRESIRRDLLRSTYLSFYKDHGETWERNRICPLHALISKKVTAEDCQIAYTFVMGQSVNPPLNNRTELLDAPTTSQMIRTHAEPDVISLDILENGKFGKSPTWFRYATLLMREYSLSFDYIIKTDSDTLLIPARFLRWVSEEEQKIDYERKQVYGGVPLDKEACGWPSHEDCQYLVAPYFHGGGLYFASIDISNYIVSDHCPRSRLFLPHEDVTMGNYVHSMTNYTGIAIQKFANMDAYHTTWKHPVKEPKRIKGLWRKYVSKKKERAKSRMDTAVGDR